MTPAEWRLRVVAVRYAKAERAWLYARERLADAVVTALSEGVTPTRVREVVER